MKRSVFPINVAVCQYLGLTPLQAMKRKTKTPEYIFSDREVGIVVHGQLRTIRKPHPNFKKAYDCIDTGKFEGIEKLFPPETVS